MRGEVVVSTRRISLSHRMGEGRGEGLKNTCGGLWACPDCSPFFDQQNGDALAHRVEKLSVGSNQRLFKCLRDRLAGTVAEMTRRYLPVQALKKGRLGDMQF